MRTLVLLILIALFSCESSLESNKIDNLETSEVRVNTDIVINNGGGGPGDPLGLTKWKATAYYKIWTSKCAQNLTQ